MGREHVELAVGHGERRISRVGDVSRGQEGVSVWHVRERESGPGEGGGAPHTNKLHHVFTLSTRLPLSSTHKNSVSLSCRYTEGGGKSCIFFSIVIFLILKGSHGLFKG